MSRWWRAYDEALQDPKLIALSDKHHRAWFNLLCVASKNGGVLPAIGTVAIELRVTKARAAEYITVLVACGLMDEIEPGKFAPHNWSSRQFKSDVSNDRVKRFRERERNVTETVTRNVSVTPPETENRNRERKDAASAAPDPEIDLFRRGKEVLGQTSGGLIKQLVTAKDGKIPLARAAIETAATKQNPREYIGAIIRNRDPPAGTAATYVDPRL